MNWRPIRGWTRLLHEREMKADSMPERLLIGPGSPPSLDPVYPELSPPLEPCPRTGRRGCRSWPQAGCWAVSSPPAEPGFGKSPSVWVCTTWRTWAAARAMTPPRRLVSMLVSISLGFHTRTLRRSQDAGNSVVNSVCRDSADGLCQFGVRLRSAHRSSRKAARGACSLTRGNQPARSADRASLAETPD